MNAEAQDFWDRAVRALHTARALITEDPDASASRAYYAAFYAVSALFAFQGKTFTKHTAVERAVHRDLVKEEKWSAAAGAAFSWLTNLRYTGDYGGGLHVQPAEAEIAVQRAELILQATRASVPEFTPWSDDQEPPE